MTHHCWDSREGHECSCDIGRNHSGDEHLAAMRARLGVQP